MNNRQDTMLKFGFIAFSVSVMMTMVIISLLFTPHASFADEDDKQKYEQRILEYHALNPTVFGPSIGPITRRAGSYSMLFTNSRIDFYQTKVYPDDFNVARLGTDCFEKYGKIDLDSSAGIAPEFQSFYTTQSSVEFDGVSVSTSKGSSWLFGQPLTGILDIKHLPVKYSGSQVQWFERAVLVSDAAGNVSVLPLGEWFREGTCYLSHNPDPTPTNTPVKTSIPTPFKATPASTEVPTGVHPGATDTPLPNDPFTPWTPTSRTGDEDDAVGIITPTLTTPIPTSTAPALSFTGGAEDETLFNLQQYYLEMYGYSAPAPAVAAPVDTDTSLWTRSDDSGGDSSSRNDAGGAQQPAPSAPDAGSNPPPAPANPPKQPQYPPKQPQDPPKGDGGE